MRYQIDIFQEEKNIQLRVHHYKRLFFIAHYFKKKKTQTTVMKKIIYETFIGLRGQFLITKGSNRVGAIFPFY